MENQYTVGRFKIIFSGLAIKFAILAGLVSCLLIPSNPDQSLPLTPELFLLTCLSISILLQLDKTKTSIVKVLSKELFLVAFIVINLLLLLLPRLYLHISSSPYQTWIPCLSAGRLAYTVECFLQSAINGHYGVRTFYMLCTSIAVGIASFLLLRLNRKILSTVVVSIILAGSIVCFMGMFSFFLNKDQLLPTSIAVNAFGSDRMTSLFPNPGWVWPYLSLSTSLLIWLLFEEKKPYLKIVISLALVMWCFVLMKTGQRGAILLLLGSFFLSISHLYILFFGFSRSKIIVPIILTLTSIFFILEFRININEFLNYILSSNKDMVTFSPERFGIWNSAWEMLQKRPFLGSGYASWFGEISDLASKGATAPVLDTAHNLWIQVLVELGLIHGMLVIGIIGCLGFLLIESDLSSTRKKGVVSSLLFWSALVCTLVQEIDYIRPTFYTFSILIGSILGWNNPKSGGHSISFSFELRSNSRIFFIVLTTILSLSTTLSYVFVSQGLFPFESNLKDSSINLERWSSPTFRLNSFKNNAGKFFTNFSTKSWVLPLSIHLQNDDLKVNLVSDPNLSIALENRARWSWMPKFHTIAASDSAIDGYRRISLRIRYPPTFSNTAIVLSKGVYDWEAFPEGLGRWCESHCWMVLRTCDQGFSLRVGTSTFAARNQKVLWKAWNIGRAIDQDKIGSILSSTQSADGYVELNEGRPSYLTMDGPKNDFFLLEMTSDRSFSPAKIIPGSSDTRALSFRVLDSECTL